MRKILQNSFALNSPLQLVPLFQRFPHDKAPVARRPLVLSGMFYKSLLLPLRFQTYTKFFQQARLKADPFLRVFYCVKYNLLYWSHVSSLIQDYFS